MQDRAAGAEQVGAVAGQHCSPFIRGCQFTQLSPGRTLLSETIDMAMSALFSIPDTTYETSHPRCGWRIAASHLSQWTTFNFSQLSSPFCLWSCPGIHDLLVPSLKHGVRVLAVKSGTCSKSGNLRLPEARSRAVQGLNPGYTYTATAYGRKKFLMKPSHFLIVSRR